MILRVELLFPSPTTLISACTRKYQSKDARTIDALLKAIVVDRVLRRSEELSTQRPILDEKHIEAAVVTKPLILGQSSPSRLGGTTYRKELADKE